MNTTNADLREALQHRIRRAHDNRMPLAIRAGGSKWFYGREIAAERIDASVHRGIVDYSPSELVLTARAGTSLADIEKLLRSERQMLAFEPPLLAGATLGGAIATALSGPARPFTGAARDFVLGVEGINGKGELLRFGGQVMKNVAGFDVSRLVCGSQGTLMLLTEISVKVVPLAESVTTLVFDCEYRKALEMIQNSFRRCLPLHGCSYYAGRLRIRLAGIAADVDAARSILGGVDDKSGDDYWHGIRNFSHTWFRQDGPLWRVSLPRHRAFASLPGESLVDWGGALHWLRTSADNDAVFRIAGELGGHATCIDFGQAGDRVFHPLVPVLSALQKKIKKAFDPQNILNPGRLYPDL